MQDWIQAHQELLSALVVFAFVTSGLSLVLLPLAIVRIPPAYFLGRRPPRLPWADAHPVLRILLSVVKNTLGLFLVLVGIGLLVLPGQGLLTILMGAVLLDFPGKRQVELALVRRRRILGFMNWIRVRADCPPLLVAGKSAESETCDLP